jgi:integrase
MESRLDLAERILKPRRLSDVATSDALLTLQSELLAGKEGRYDPPRRRSPHTVKAHVASVIAALNFACEMGWLQSVPKIRKLKVSKLRHAKGRPITLEEFERMLDATEKIVGEAAAESWKYLLRGAWESGLRLAELLHVSWDDTNAIHPVWQRGRLPVLTIPARLQKNATEEAIPLLPGFEQLLLETPPCNRVGLVFNPMSLQTRLGRSARNDRPRPEWVGKVISRIGEKAGVIVRVAELPTKSKHASAHDLRRSLAERLCDAGVPEREVSRVMRHADPLTTRRHYAPGTVQNAAGIIRRHMAGRPRQTNGGALKRDGKYESIRSG